MLDLAQQHLQCNGVEPAFRNDDIHILLARFYKLLMHGLYRIHILADNRIKGTATLLNISEQPTDQSDVCVGIDIDRERAGGDGYVL